MLFSATLLEEIKILAHKFTHGKPVRRSQCQSRHHDRGKLFAVLLPDSTIAEINIIILFGFYGKKNPRTVSSLSIQRKPPNGSFDRLRDRERARIAIGSY